MSPAYKVCAPGWGESWEGKGLRTTHQAAPPHTALTAQAPSPSQTGEWGRGLGRPVLKSQPRRPSQGPAFPKHHLHHWHFLVNLGKYSTSLSLTASLYPQRKLKIADGLLHLHPPLNHHHLFLFQSDCRRR